MHLLPVPDAVIFYSEDFLSEAEASEFFEVLFRKCKWERRPGPFGSPVPRDEAYYGDPGTQYTYSRRQYLPLPWFPELLSLKHRAERATPAEAYGSSPNSGYNAVLCNLYRNGLDSVGLHADAEPEMGPLIASVSLGAERMFKLRKNGGAVVYSERLRHGSLLIMTGDVQKNFKHEVPKEPGISEPRINLTFRHVQRSKSLPVK
ncbi:MAG TPA: alpha-ketoglutarate-dependent dioxygenase AlkB [Terriglobales bacterium]|nr:alpha-ketoglutarate-dependent dioxygenase AlkB [Terriglobales bacterium]